MNFVDKDAASAEPCKPSFDPRVVELYVGAGMNLFPVHGKRPFHSAWQRRKYDGRAEAAAAEGKHNLGVQLSADVVVLDADAKRGGVESLARLAADLGFSLDDYACVRTGGGGVHVYMSKDPTLLVPGNLDKAGYPGIDLKTKGGQVVAPGSIHPDTMRAYVGGDMARLALQVPAPQALVEMIRGLKSSAPSEHRTEPGVWTPDELAQNLANLDPDEFDDYKSWLDVGMAAHHATNGDGFEEFAEWSERFSGDAASRELLEEKWRSFSIKADGITHRHICKLLHDRGVRVHDEIPAELDFDQVEDQSTVDHRTKGDELWPFLTMEELEALPPPQWLVDGFLLEETLVAIYGPFESFKSFLAVDFVMSIAAGLPWHGHETQRGSVLYIAAEGARGIGKRARAWMIEHGVSRVPFHLMRHNLNLTNVKEAAAFTAHMVKRLGPLRMIVIDTLNQTSAGADENSAKDMSLYIDAMKRMREESSATVVVVHHTGKDPSKGMRGSTALPGGFDTTIEVIRPNSDGPMVIAKMHKQKDEERAPPIQFETTKVAGSLVLRMTKGSVPGSDAQFVSEEVRLFDWIAKEMGDKETMPLGKLLRPLQDAAIIVGKERTLRDKLMKLLGEGFDDAKRCSDGSRIWLERDRKNPETGPITVRKIGGEA